MNQSASELPAKERFDFDAIVVGGGFGGLRMVVLRKLGIPLDAVTRGGHEFRRYLVLE